MVEKDDMLVTMFNKQKVFQRRVFGVDVPSEQPHLIPITVTSLIAEVGEILEEYQFWKHWRKNPPEVDYKNLNTEIADLWHFVINLSLFLGYDAKDVFDCFIEKNKINHERQDNGY